MVCVNCKSVKVAALCKTLDCCTADPLLSPLGHEVFAAMDRRSGWPPSQHNEAPNPCDVAVSRRADLELDRRLVSARQGNHAILSYTR